MIYLDTSLIVAALTHEPETRRIQDWLSRQDTSELTISDWVTTEFSSALAIKVRTGKFDMAHRAHALAVFRQLSVESFGVAPVTAEQFRRAAGFADRHELALRAGDALHLAIAADHGAELCTLDRRLANGGLALGVRTRLI